MTPDHLNVVGFLMLEVLGGCGHCVGMCSPFVFVVARQPSSASPAGR